MFVSNVEILKYNSVLFIPWSTEVNWVVRWVIIGMATFKQFMSPGGHIPVWNVLKLTTQVKTASLQLYILLLPIKTNSNYNNNGNPGRDQFLSNLATEKKLQ